jgi:CheY-like chemotaxis protein
MRRVLVVEDMPTQRFLMAGLLSHCDCAVFSASSGPEALTIAAEVEPDVALLDLVLPEMDGYELARRLRTEAGERSIKIVAVSAWDCDRQKLTEAGIDQYLRKPVMLAELKRAVGAGNHD